MRNKTFTLALILLFVLGFDIVLAQCPMCRTSVESAMAQGDKKGMGLNSGILYLMAFPYVIACCTIIFYFYNKRKIHKKDTESVISSHS